MYCDQACAARGMRTSWSGPRGEGRIVLTHDVATMTGFAYRRVAAGQPMPGLFEIPKRMPVGRAVEEILTIDECSDPNEWEGKVQYLPL